MQARTTTLSFLRTALVSAFIATVDPSRIPTGLDPIGDARTAVSGTPHRFVWDEIVRHRTIVPAYDRMLAAMPEALSW